MTYRDLRYLRLRVDDLDAATDLVAGIFALMPGDRDAARAMFRSDHRNYALCCSLTEDPAVALSVGQPEDLDRLEERLRQAGHAPARLSPAECAARQVHAALAVAAPNGVSVELVLRALTSGWPCHGARDAGITGFAAVSLACRDMAANEAFWTRDLGLRVSDHVGDAVFLALDEAHHRVALYPSARDGILGAAWAVETRDHIMRNWYHLQKMQQPVVAGPGRQPFSGACFVTRFGFTSTRLRGPSARAAALWAKMSSTAAASAADA
ncbi:MAG: VOC family protein [Paracoccus sp. (in: a-proteobacteria)]|nr:VOC family protein [Paracoccus sp. (in: a-proteobacteria)]